MIRLRSLAAHRAHASACVLLFALGAAHLNGEDDARRVRELERATAKVVEVWVDLAETCLEEGARAPAEEALARARRLAPKEERLAALEARAATLEDGGSLGPALARRVARAHKDAAKALDRLARVLEDEEEDPRYATWLQEALELDETKARLAKVVDLAKKGALLVKSPTHEAVAWLSLPRGWKPGGSWPVLVSVDGAGANFRGNARTFQGARGSRDWITLAPHALSCTNQLDPAKYAAYPPGLLAAHDGDRVSFDVAGLLAILDHVRARFGGEERVVITGFSGGGNLCYGFLLRHPERVRLAVPACANFQPGLARGAARPEEGGPPIRILTGEKDPHRFLTHGKTPPGIEEQTDWAVKSLEDQGFQDVVRTMLPGVGHSALPAEVWERVDELAKGAR